MAQEKMLRLLAVGVGGFIGSVFRYAISLKMNEQFSDSLILYSTLIVNVIGSFFIGIILELSTQISISAVLKLFLTTGFLGGLTTFSTMSYETISLIVAGEYGRALLNVFLNLASGLSAAYVGKITIDWTFFLLHT